MLPEILQKRLVEEKRNEIADNGKSAKDDYRSCKILPVITEDIIFNITIVRLK